jgi:hypothetical protein
MWRCIVLVCSSEQFDGLEMKALQSFEMMGTAHSLMSQHHILEDLNLQCVFHCASLYISTSLFIFFWKFQYFFIPSLNVSRMLKLSCHIYFGVVRFEVPTAVSLGIQVFWHLMRCCWISVSWYSNGTLPSAWTHQTLKLEALHHFEMPGNTNLVTLCHIPDSLNLLHLNYSQMLSKSLIY